MVVLTKLYTKNISLFVFSVLVTVNKNTIPKDGIFVTMNRLVKELNLRFYDFVVIESKI